MLLRPSLVMYVSYCLRSSFLKFKVGASKVTFNHDNIVIKISFSAVIFQIQADELKLVPMQWSKYSLKF
jgi:hypothetical protein